MVDVRHSSSLGGVLYGVACLLFGANEEDNSATTSDLLDEGLSLGKQHLSAQEIDDVDAFALTKDVATHLRIPTPRLVSEVDSSFEQFPQSDRVCGGGHTYSLS